MQLRSVLIMQLVSQAELQRWSGSFYWDVHERVRARFHRLVLLCAAEASLGSKIQIYPVTTASDGKLVFRVCAAVSK